MFNNDPIQNGYGRIDQMPFEVPFGETPGAPFEPEETPGEFNRKKQRPLSEGKADDSNHNSDEQACWDDSYRDEADTLEHATEEAVGGGSQEDFPSENDQQEGIDEEEEDGNKEPESELVKIVMEKETEATMNSVGVESLQPVQNPSSAPPVGKPVEQPNLNLILGQVQLLAAAQQPDQQAVLNQLLSTLKQLIPPAQPAAPFQPAESVQPKSQPASEARVVSQKVPDSPKSNSQNSEHSEDEPMEDLQPHHSEAASLQDCGIDTSVVGSIASAVPMSAATRDARVPATPISYQNQSCAQTNDERGRAPSVADDQSYYNYCSQIGLQVQKEGAAPEGEPAEDQAEFRAHGLNPRFALDKCPEKTMKTLLKFKSALTDPELLGQFTLKNEYCSVHLKQKKTQICHSEIEVDRTSRDSSDPAEDSQPRKVKVIQEHLCELCVIDERHANKEVSPISKLAKELVSGYSKVFAQFQANIQEISKVHPQAWKIELRKNYMSLFDELSKTVEEVRDRQLKAVANIFSELNVDDVNKLHNNLVYSRDLSLRQQKLLNHLFDNNKFCAIAKLDSQFKSFNGAVEFLSKQTGQLQEMTASKRQKLDSMTEKVTAVMERINEETVKSFELLSEEISVTPSKLQEIEQRELTATQAVQNKFKIQARRQPFFHFLTEMQPRVEAMDPTAKYMEVIAFLQQQWTRLPQEDRLRYEQLAANEITRQVSEVSQVEQADQAAAPAQSPVPQEDEVIDITDSKASPEKTSEKDESRESESDKGEKKRVLKLKKKALQKKQNLEAQAKPKTPVHVEEDQYSEEERKISLKEPSSPSNSHEEAEVYKPAAAPEENSINKGPAELRDSVSSPGDCIAAVLRNYIQGGPNQTYHSELSVNREQSSQDELEEEEPPRHKNKHLKKRNRPDTQSDEDELPGDRRRQEQDYQNFHQAQSRPQNQWAHHQQTYAAYREPQAEPKEVKAARHAGSSSKKRGIPTPTSSGGSSKKLKKKHRKRQIERGMGGNW